MQHTCTHCNILQRTATHCNTLQHTARQCKTLQHTATYCNTLQTLQHTATHYDTLQHTAMELTIPFNSELTFDSRANFREILKSQNILLTARPQQTLHQHCNTLQHTATQSSTRQHSTVEVQRVPRKTRLEKLNYMVIEILNAGENSVNESKSRKSNISVSHGTKSN